MRDITVVIPTIAPRAAMLKEAVESVEHQSLKANLIVWEDSEHQGAAKTRHAGLMAVQSPWVAFLDDDDLFMLKHLEKMMNHAEETNADYVFSWFYTLPLGCDPFPESHYLDPWDPQNPRQTTVTTLVRTSLAQEVGFLGEADRDTNDGQQGAEDWWFTLGCNRLGKISHLVDRTWYWRHWGFSTPYKPQGNTSGRGDRW